MASVGSQQISIDVLDYCQESDNFDENVEGHIFTLEVKLHGHVGNNFIIRRSYSSMIEFDAKLRRTFPKSNILSLPLGLLEGSKEGQKIDATLNSLSQYFVVLLEIPEVLRSSDFCNFLDFEYANGVVPSSSANTSVLDIILAGSVPLNKTVIRTFEVALEVKTTDVIAWSFTTKSRDIGFSITLDGTDLLAYQRYNSHIDPVMGTIEVPNDGTALLLFDNTYSKILAKSLTYSTAVLSAAEIEQTTSSIRQSIMYGKWRSILRRCLMQQAADLTPRGSVLQTDQLLHGLSLEEIRCDKLESDVEEMRKQNATLRDELKEAKKLLAQTTVDKEELTSRLNSAQEEAVSLRAELEEALLKSADAEKALRESEAKSRGDMDGLRVHTQKMAMQLQEQQRVVEKLKDESERTALDNMLLRDSATRLKGEKKKLREFCLEMRGTLQEAKTACDLGEDRERELLARAEAAEDIIRNTLEPLQLKLAHHLNIYSTLLPAEGVKSAAPIDGQKDAESEPNVQCDVKDSLEHAKKVAVEARELLDTLPSPIVARSESDCPVADSDAHSASSSVEEGSRATEEEVRRDSGATRFQESSLPKLSQESPKPSRSSSFSARKEQFKTKMAAAAALAAAKAPMKRRSSSDGSAIKRRSSEAKVKVISGLKKAATKLESSMDKAMNFLDVEGLLGDDDVNDDVSWHNSKKPPGLGTYYV